MEEYNEKYKKGIIYTLICLETGDFYIGSTINFNARKQHHRSLTMKTTIPIIERGSYIFEVVEKYSCNSKKELLERENYYINTFKDCLNKRPAVRDIYDTKIKKRECDKKYREKNKEHINKKRREKYIPKTKVILTIEQKKENKKEARLKWNEKHNKRIECKCGGSYMIKHKTTHFKTKKHKEHAEE